MKIITAPNGKKLTQEDNNRIAKLDKAILELGDSIEAVKGCSVVSTKARTELQNAEVLLENVKTFLDDALAAEYRLATYKTKKAIRAEG